MQHIESRIVVISIITVPAFPLYYFIWHDLFPQPYESLSLRLIGCAVFIPLIFIRHWPSWAGKHISIYWYFATLFGLPFFFTFMLLMNAASTVWLMSALIAVFFMILINDLSNLIVQFVIGVGLAYFAYSLYAPQSLTLVNYWIYLPIYFFAIIGGGLLNFSSTMLQQERLRVMLTTASNIAHELRTPLLGIKGGAAGLQQYLPTLLESYRLASEHNLNVAPIRLVHLNSMHGVLDRIESEADHSNTIIDMLLMNTRLSSSTMRALDICSINKCVATAIERYPFATEKEKQLVKWSNTSEFKFRGIELLLVHVLFNLIKNSLYHISKAGKGDIEITLRSTPQGNELVFRDAGTGIPPSVLPHIFTRFYSWSSDNDSGLGAGIGLAFCRSVMNSFGGKISCESRAGEYTEFVLTFPFLETA